MARKTGSHSGITGPRVREAALELISQHGFAAVSMRQIAAEVGIQAGALYNYTSDKQSLLFDLMRGHMEELLEARAEAGAAFGKAGPTERLEAFTRFHIRWHVPRTRAVFVAYMELRNLSKENFTEIERLRKVYEDELEQILLDGIEASEFRIEDTKVTTLAIIAMLTGMTNWYREGGRLPVEQIETLYWGLVSRAVGVGDIQ